MDVIGRTRDTSARAGLKIRFSWLPCNAKATKITDCIWFISMAGPHGLVSKKLCNTNILGSGDCFEVLLN